MKKRTSAFTLIELMIVIAIIGFIFVGMGNINFTTTSDKQKVEQFTNKIIAKIETARNNAMIGRAIKKGNTYEIPKTWTVVLSTGTLSVSSKLPDDTTNNFDSFSLSEPNSPNVTICGDTKQETITFNGNGENSGNNGKIGIGANSNCDNNIVILKITYRGHTFTVHFDTVTGLITKEYKRK